jgi:hypothetical protein
VLGGDIGAAGGPPDVPPGVRIIGKMPMGGAPAPR